MTAAAPFVLVVGHEAQIHHEEGAAALLRQLGALVRTLDLWQEARGALEDGDAPCRCIVVEAGERPDLAVTALRAVRREGAFAEAPALLAVTLRQVARVDPSSGFDDFVLVPLVPAELYARIRALEWRRSEFSTEERHKVGGLVIDRPGQEVTVDGRRIVLTAKEFALLAYLAAHRGKVLSRETLLARVWGSRYEGGARTVDIHVRRLRAKLGEALPLETLRGSGYKMRAPPSPSVSPPRP